MTGMGTLDAPTGSREPSGTEVGGRGRFDIRATVAAVTTVVVVSLVRVITIGFDPVAADDSAYVGVGRALWHLREPLSVNGELFTIRSWLYPLLTGGASLMVGGDPLTGPRILGWTLGTTALALAVVIGFRLGRGLAAVATAGALLATPVLWTVVPSTRVDVALVCSTMVLLLVMDRSSPRRMLIGGIVAGVTLLVKETSAPLIFLPLAYLGTLPRDEWRRLAFRYALGFVITVSWWFVTVLVLVGGVFPFEGMSQASNRDVPRGWELNSSARLLIGAWILGWLVVAIRRRHEPRARILMIAGLAFVPASVIAYEKDFALRQFVPIVILSCIALGVALGDGALLAVRKAPRGATRSTVAVLIAVMGVVALVPVVLTQDRTAVAVSPGQLDIDLARWINARPGDPVVTSTFKFKAMLWLRTEGQATIRSLAFEGSRKPLPLRPAVAVDIRSDGYHSLTRAELGRQARGADYLVLTGPHRLGPVGLASWLDLHGRDVGFVPVERFGPDSGTPWARIYRVDDPRVDKIPTVISTLAAEKMIAEGGFRPVGPTVLAGTLGGIFRVGKVVPPDRYETLHARLF